MEWFIAHLIGDYLLQNDWMARGKRDSSLICTVHVMAYIIPFLFINLAWWQISLIAVQHWLQDRTHVIAWTLRVTGKDDFLRSPMAPWSVILTDNIWHILWIFTIIQMDVFL